MNDRLEWLDEAACRGEDPELFFPVGQEGPALRQTKEAKAICWGQCPVRAQCLTWALNEGFAYGVFGGASEQERADMLYAGGRKRRAKYTQQGKKTVLAVHQVEEVLGLLDSGYRLPVVEQRTGIGREVCRRVWRENRTAKNPPGHNSTQAQVKERLAR